MRTPTRASATVCAGARAKPSSLVASPAALSVVGWSNRVGHRCDVPASAEARGNLHVGGKAVKTTIDARDREIISTVAPFLREHGQILVGLDVIGGMLTELNITSPTGVRDASRLDNTNVAAPIMERFQELARAVKK